MRLIRRFRRQPPDLTTLADQITALQRSVTEMPVRVVTEMTRVVPPSNQERRGNRALRACNIAALVALIVSVATTELTTRAESTARDNVSAAMQLESESAALALSVSEDPPTSDALPAAIKAYDRAVQNEREAESEYDRAKSILTWGHLFAGITAVLAAAWLGAMLSTFIERGRRTGETLSWYAAAHGIDESAL